MSFVILPAIEQKLKDKHKVTKEEVFEAVLNRDREPLEEVRLQNKGKYPRYWFIGKTNAGRELKIIYALDPDFSTPLLVSAFEPNNEEKRIYEKYAQTIS